MATCKSSTQGNNLRLPRNVSDGCIECRYLFSIEHTGYPLESFLAGRLDFPIATKDYYCTYRGGCKPIVYRVLCDSRAYKKALRPAPDWCELVDHFEYRCGYYIVTGFDQLSKDWIKQELRHHKYQTFHDISAVNRELEDMFDCGELSTCSYDIVQHIDEDQWIRYNLTPVIKDDVMSWRIDPSEVL